MSFDRRPAAAPAAERNAGPLPAAAGGAEEVVNVTRTWKHPRLDGSRSGRPGGGPRSPRAARPLPPSRGRPGVEPLETRTLLSGTAPAEAEPSPDAPRDLLFFGNSFTRFNGVPELVGSIAAAARHPSPNVVTQLVDGAGLAYHLDVVRAAGTSSVVDAAPRGSWDTVIVQGHSLEPTRLGDAAAFRAGVAGLVERVRAHSPAAGAVLYQTWARGPLSPVYPSPFASPADMHAELRAGYATARADLAAGATAARANCASATRVSSCQSWAASPRAASASATAAAVTPAVVSP